ncbi:MAG: lysylphosphatidylglycerol synthase transmembrane domain-containing protein [Candidatus Nanoarchaeia archaeon]
MNNRLSFLLAAILTVLIFIAIFAIIDIGLFFENLANIDPWLFFISLILLIPPFLLLAYRWKFMISDFSNVSFWQSFKLNIVGQSINLVTPAKLGDFTKAYFARTKKLNGKVALGACFFEKLLDFFMLSIFALFGIIGFYTEMAGILILGILLIIVLVPIFLLAADFGGQGRFMRVIRLIMPFKRPSAIIEEIFSYFQTIKKNKKNVARIFFINFLLWLVFIFQGYVLLLAVGVEISIIHAYGLLPLAIFVGLLPVTVSGIGTRDTAFIFLFSSFAGSEVMVLYGLLFSLRYILPALLGLVWAKEIMEKKKKLENM